MFIMNALEHNNVSNSVTNQEWRRTFLHSSKKYTKIENDHDRLFETH